MHKRYNMPCSKPKLSPSSLCAGFLLLCLGLCLAGCGEDDKPYRPEYTRSAPSSTIEYIFAPHPLLNAQKLAEVYGAMLDHINAGLTGERIRLKLEASRSYTAFNEKLLRREVHFALPNPYQTVLAQDCGYLIFGKADNDETFRGVVILRKDSPIRTVQELRGATVSFPAPTALAATMMPELFFKEQGLDPRKDMTQLFVGTHESAMLNVCMGATVAACTWPAAWENFKKDHPDKAKIIEVRWQTSNLPSNGLIVRDDVPETVRKKVANAFFSLGETPEGQRILHMASTSRYVPADNSTYAPVHDFISRYAQSVRAPKGLHE